MEHENNEEEFDVDPELDALDKDKEDDDISFNSVDEQILNSGGINISVFMTMLEIAVSSAHIKES